MSKKNHKRTAPGSPDFLMQYSKIVDSTNNVGGASHRQWEKEGDMFEIFTMNKKGYSSLSCDTELRQSV